MTAIVDRLRAWAGGADAAPAASDPLPPAGPPPPVAADRRRRDLAPSEMQLRGSIAQKALHGWLQNRHQTLMPLSVDLERLSPEDGDRLARFAAMAADAGGDPDGRERVRAWLLARNAGGAMRAAYEDALARPTGPNDAMAGVATAGLPGHAFVVALVAAKEGIS